MLLTADITHTLSAADEDVLLAALESLHATSAEFGDFLSNHGPMVVDSMIRLGHADQVALWVARYRTQLEPRQAPRRPIDSDQWTSALGDVRRLADWSEHFRRELALDHWRTVLAQWWERLLPGAAAAAGHGLIRTAHAVRNLAGVERPHPLLLDELAYGLGYWAARFQVVPGSPTLDGWLNATAALARIPTLGRDTPSGGPGIIGRLASVARVRGFADALDDFGFGGEPMDGLDAIISATTQLLARRTDSPIAFCHAVTAPAAVQLVLPHLPLALHRRSVSAAWLIASAIVAGFAAAGPDARADVRPDARQLEHRPLSSRYRVAEAAIAHGDDHVIKLTDALIARHDRLGGTHLLRLADDFRRRMPPLR